MTLGSYVRIEQPTPPEPLLDMLTVLVGGDSGTALRHSIADGHIGNRLGQGFDAIVDVTYGLDGPLQLDYLDLPDPTDPDAPWTPAPPAAVQVDLDTGYSYGDERGRDCVALHRDLAVAVANHVGASVWFCIDCVGEWERVEPSGVTA